MIHLRPMTEDDTDQIICWRNADDVRFNFIQQELIDRDIHQNWVHHHLDEGKGVQFIIVDDEAKVNLGTIFLHSIDPIQKTAEMGIFLAQEQYRSKGIGQQAIVLIKQFATDELHLQQLTLRVLASNLRGIHSYRKSGFTEQFSESIEIPGQGLVEVIHMAVQL